MSRRPQWPIRSGRDRRKHLLASCEGYFDLDPSRTLDVIYDAFIASITTHHRFFVDLLRCSTWAAPKPTAPINAPDMDLAFENGSSVAAQVLGFKFRHYQDQSVIRNGEETPREMYLMAGVMIKEGLVQLKHLLEHVSSLVKSLRLPFASSADVSSPSPTS